jgi:hypothetical protein
MDGPVLSDPALILGDSIEAARNIHNNSDLTRRGYRLDFQFEEPYVQPGSVELILPVIWLTLDLTHFSAPSALPLAGMALSGPLAWAVDKALGGALSEFGKQLTQRVICHWPKNANVRETPLTIFDSERSAWDQLEKIKAERGCAHAFRSEGEFGNRGLPEITAIAIRLS